jgi:diguanylate cyclase (GGDEF)-like protein/PAS domain S-box-containing protein
VERVRWSRAELRSLVQGRAVFLRDPTSAARAVPDWLAQAAAGVWTLDSHESIATVHPDDRPLVVETFVSAVEHPGVPYAVRVRALEGDHWGHAELMALNQLDNDEIGALVCTRRIVTGPPVEAPVRRGERGESDATPWVLAELDETAIVVAIRGQVEGVFGYRPEDLIGRSAVSLLHPDALAETIADWRELLADPTATFVNRRRWLRADGTEVWLESSCLHGGEGRIIAVLIDVTDRMAREREMEQLTAQLRLLADEVPTALARCDTEGRVLFHNARWADLAGDGTAPIRLDDIVAGPDAAVLAEARRQVASGPSLERRVLEVPGIDGTATWQITLRAVGPPASDRVIVASVADVTDTVRLRRQARLDGLTGVLNRSALEDRLAVALAEDAAGTLVLFLDLDGFKGVNDTRGHDAGDVVLREIGRRLGETVREGDEVGRYGGDEFVVICRAVAPGDEPDIAARVGQVLAEPIGVPGGVWWPAASVGCARGRPADDLTAVLRRADLDMLRLKQSRDGSPRRASAVPDRPVG